MNEIRQVFQCRRCEKVFDDIKKAEIHEPFCKIRQEYSMTCHRGESFAELLDSLLHNLDGSNWAQCSWDAVTKAQDIKALMHKFIDEVNKLPKKMSPEDK